MFDRMTGEQQMMTLCIAVICLLGCVIAGSIAYYNATVDKAAIEAGLHQEVVGVQKVWTPKK